MTKLEQKLIQLGYKDVYFGNWHKVTKHKFVKKIVVLNNEINTDKCGVYWIKKSSNRLYTTQQDIDNLQQAFNQLQQDLEVLKECTDI